MLRTLGREDELKASGQLEQLAASFARLDPPPAGTRRHVGPLLLVRHYVDRLGLVGLIDDAVPMRGRAMLTHGEVIAALVANRLCGPAPLYDVAGWASSAALAELFGVPAGLLNDDRLGRALEALAPVAERVRGELALAAASRCGADLSRLHLDMTAVRFTGGYEGSALVARGVGRRPHHRPAGQDPAGVHPHRGRGLLPRPPGRIQRGALRGRGAGPHPRADPARRGLCRRLRVRLPGPAVRRRRRRTAVRGAAARRHRLGPVVRRRHRRRHRRPARLDYCAQRERRLPADQRTRWNGVLRDREVFDDDTGRTHRLRIAYIWSSEEATSVADARDRALTKAEEALTRIRNGLGGRHYKTKKQVDDRVATVIGARIAEMITVTTGVAADGTPTIAWHRNPDAIAAACPTRRALRHRHQPARPTRPPTDRARRARHLQRPVDRRTTPP